MEDTFDFGSILKTVRKISELRQEQFAKLLGVSRAAYIFYEQSKRSPDVKKIRRLCKETGIDANFLLGITDQISDEDIDKLKGLKEKFIYKKDILRWNDVVKTASDSKIPADQIEGEEKFYSARNIAEMLGVNMATAYAVMHSDGFPLIKLSERRLIVPAKKFQEWINMVTASGESVISD